MEFKEFIEEAKQHIKEYLPEEWQNGEVIVKEQYKNNGVNLHSISIRTPENGLAPRLYLEDFYKLYINGVSMEDTLQSIGREYMKAVRTAPDLSKMDFTYENVRDKLILCAVNAEKNKELLSIVPHQRVEDLAVVYQCVFTGEDEGVGTLMINNAHLKLWGIGADDLHEYAKNNTPKIFPYILHSMEYVMADINGVPIKENKESMENSKMFVLSNARMWQGASYLFCPAVLEAASMELGGNLLILPSSVHELILVRQTDGSDIEALKKIVREVNQNEVAVEDRLSDEIYQYDAVAGKMSMIPSEGTQHGMYMGR